MTREELIIKVRHVKELVNKPGLEEALKESLEDQHSEKLDAFDLSKTDVDQLGDKLETADLEEKAKLLEILSGQLNDSIEELEDAVTNMNNAIKVVETLGKVVELASRIAVLL